MPRYRLIAPLPPVLEYRSARFILERRRSLYGGEFLQARKDEPRYNAQIIAQAVTAEELDRVLATGFDVAPGTPADKIMHRLVLDGVATVC